VGSRHLCGANRAAQMRKPALHRYNEVLISLLGSLLRFNHPDSYAFLKTASHVKGESEKRLEK
jgi:hypothetical protein